jgi:hypothetical protein
MPILDIRQLSEGCAHPSDANQVVSRLDLAGRDPACQAFQPAGRTYLSSSATTPGRLLSLITRDTLPFPLLVKCHARQFHRRIDSVRLIWDSQIP